MQLFLTRSSLDAGIGGSGFAASRFNQDHESNEEGGLNPQAKKSRLVWEWSTSTTKTLYWFKACGTLSLFNALLLQACNRLCLFARSPDNKMAQGDGIGHDTSIS